MTAPLDLAGKEFHKITVIDRAENSKYGQTRWNCICKCGTMFTTVGTNLIGGKTKSCGCIGKEKIGVLNKTHGLTKSKIYNSWRGMKSRCSNPKDSHYHFYGGRGIAFSKDWADFNGFYQDMGEDYRDGLELDRIDVNGDYCKENCRWSSQAEQCYNQRLRKDNSTGRTGVNWHAKNCKWTASIRFNNKTIYLGSFINFEDAVKAREQAEIKYYRYNRE